MKICAKCSREFPDECFYKDKSSQDGRAYWCKSCVKSNVRRHYYGPNHEEILRKARDAKRNLDPRKKLYIQRDYQNHPEKHHARWAVNNAVRDGRLFKSPCHCGETKVEAHHDDYSKPLDVVWLCNRHHKIRDRMRAHFP